MKRTLLLLAGCAVLLGSSQVANANVYASRLRGFANGNGTFTLQYRLNESADNGVTVTVRNNLNAVVRTMAQGAQTTGAKSLQWDGKDNSAVTVPLGSYKFEVTAADDGYTTYTRLDLGTTTTQAFFAPYGCAVNTIQSTDGFGDVYVSTNGGLTGSGRNTPDGVYILSADMADITGQGNASYAGGVTWGGTNSPFRLGLDDSGRLFIVDWSDTHSGIWSMDATSPASPFTQVLDNTGRIASGLVAGLHGSISHVVATGYDTSRTLYTVDEDYYPGAATGTGSGFRYPVGTTLTNYNVTPTFFYDDVAAGNLNQNFNSNLAIANGGYWLTQVRSAADTVGVPCLWHVNSSTTSGTVDYNSASSSIAGQLNASSNAGLAINPAGTRLYFTGNAYVRVFNISAGPVLTPVEILNTTNGKYSGQFSQQPALDAAGNLYVGNSTVEILRVYSPNDGPNSFTTAAPASQALVLGAAAQEWMSYY